MTPLEARSARGALYELSDYFLGKDFVIADPASPEQAYVIIVDEIKSRYKGQDESPKDKWRQRHKKCAYCKYCSFTPEIMGKGPFAWCEVKLRRVNKRKSRYLCSAFTLKRGDNNE